jgi:ubiquinone/menaquinone biosynthesis C-methylase UbiE
MGMQPMYAKEETARLFAERQQNERHRAVSDALDRVLVHALASHPRPWHATSLGAGAHPDRYDQLFALLLEEPRGIMDWVDDAAVMSVLAQEYLEKAGLERRRDVLSFIQKGIEEYLSALPDVSLDAAIMQYTMSFFPYLDPLFVSFARVMKPGGIVVATIGILEPVLKSVSGNARYSLNGEEVPLGETRPLQDGDQYLIKFLKEYKNPDAGYLEGAETVHYYHAKETIIRLGEAEGFETIVGDWRTFVPEEKQVGGTSDATAIIFLKK